MPRSFPLLYPQRVRKEEGASAKETEKENGSFYVVLSTSQRPLFCFFDAEEIWASPLGGNIIDKLYVYLGRSQE